MDHSGSRQNASSPRAVAAYLISLKPVLAGATATRQQWVRRIGLLMADTRHGNATSLAHAAGAIGREHISSFRETRRNLDRLHPPPTCRTCHLALAGWIDRLVESSDVLMEIGQSLDLKRLRETQDLLMEARTFARQFNSEYSVLVTNLRALVATATKVKSERVAVPPERTPPPARRPGTPRRRV